MVRYGSYFIVWLVDGDFSWDAGQHGVLVCFMLRVLCGQAVQAVVGTRSS